MVRGDTNQGEGWMVFITPLVKNQAAAKIEANHQRLQRINKIALPYSLQKSH
jgi:hypothetical protein